MAGTFDTIILRFRDLVTENNGTIERHRNIIQQYGYVWWGWWKKGNEVTPQQEFSGLSTLAKTNPIEIFLVDSGQGVVYKSVCENIDLRYNQKMPSPEKERTPEYYRDQEYYAWFKFTKIEPSVESELKGFSYVDCPNLFLDTNTDYSKFNDKRIYSVSELVQQNRTVWFVRKAKETDRENEIVLLNPEIIQPTHFSTKYFQSSGDTLIWLSDLHLADNVYEFQSRSVHKTLAAHICDCMYGSAEQTNRIAGLLITGDITSRAETKGFDSAKQLLKDLNSKGVYPVSSENIVICPGNHDFIREDSDLEKNKDPEYIYNKLENAEGYTDFYKSIYNISPNRDFSMGRKILLSSGHMLEIAALNSLILQQYKNFDGHGYLSQEQLEYVAKQMHWENKQNSNAIRIVMMHHHYLPTCYTESINPSRASSAVYDADRLINWLVKHDVKVLLHGHKHRTFVSKISYPKNQNADIKSENMHNLLVVGMGGTGAKGVQNKFSAISFEKDDIIINFYDIYSDESHEDHLCQTIKFSI